MHSNAIYESLSRILKTTIAHVTLVEHNDGEYYVCVGSHSFFIIDSKIEQILSEVYYAHVQRIMVDSQQRQLLLIQLSADKEANIPSKLIFKVDDRRSFIDQIRLAWKTDYMFRTAKVTDLPVFQGEVQTPNAHFKIQTKSVPAYLLEPMQSWNKFEVKRYSFFMPGTHVQTNKNDNTFYHYSSQKKLLSKITIQVSDEIPLDSLTHMDGKEEINIYCEEFANKLIANESKVWILSSRSYKKRCNLNQDIACWQGWEVHLRTPKRDILVILLRRKFIPPLLDYFVDFIVIVEGAEKSANAIAKLSKKDAHFPDTANLLEDGRRIADSIHSNFTTFKMYDAFIKKRADTLYYEEETLNYLQYRHPNKIKPRYTLYGVAFIVNILKLLSKFDSNVNTVFDIVQEKYQDELEDQWSEPWDPFNDPPSWDEVKTALEKKLIPVKKNQTEDKNENWDFKVSKYLAFCVDGGLLNFYFTLGVLVEFYLAHSNSQNAQPLNQIITYLLHFKKESEKEPFDYQVSLVSKINEMMYSREKCTYNEKVMITLLTAGYFKKELTGADRPLLYPKFLTYMLDTCTNPFLKSSICTQINKDQIETKASATNLDINITEAKALVKPLLWLYQSDNFRLATLAVVSLASLCARSKDIKQFIMAEGDDIILHQLDARDEDLLLFTLRLLEYLMLISQNIQVLVSKGVVNKILEILEGSGIVGVFYSDKILTLCCQILSLIMTNLHEYNKLITSQIKLIMSLFEIPRKDPISEVLVSEIMNLFMIKIIDKDKSAIEVIGENTLEVFLNLLKADYFRTTDLQNRILTFLLGFKDSPKMLAKIKEAEITAKIQEYVGEHTKKASILLRELQEPV